jgi:hypothetical protein
MPSKYFRDGDKTGLFAPGRKQSDCPPDGPGDEVKARILEVDREAYNYKKVKVKVFYETT